MNKKMVVVIVFLTLLCGLGARMVYAQQAAKAKDSGPVMPDALKLKMRDVQFLILKNTQQLQQLVAQYNALSTDNADLTAKMMRFADESLDQAKLDSKIWRVNFDTLAFEKIPVQTPEAKKK